MRAHNQGRIGFYQHAGVKKVRWLTAEDDRVCPVCGPLSEKVFAFEDAPNIPAHPACRCTVVAELDDEDVGSIATPEEYGVLGDEPLDDPATSFLPPPLDRNSPGVKFLNFSGNSGPGFYTDAVGVDREQLVQTIGASVSSCLESVGLPIQVPANGIELRLMTTKQLGGGGRLGIKQHRAVVALLDPLGNLRQTAAVVATTAEELIHHSSIKMGFVDFGEDGGFAVRDKGLSRALRKALDDRAERDPVVKSILLEARGYRDEDQEVELLAKVYKYAAFSDAGKILMDDSLVSDIFRIARKLGFGSLG